MKVQRPLLLALGAIAATAATAAERPLWELGAGAGSLSLPHYRGAAESRRWVLPVPFYVYRGPILRADRDGARAVLLESERIDLDVSLAATAPTHSVDEPTRAGMPDLPATLELGPKLNLHLLEAGDWRLDLRVPLRGAVTLQSHPHAAGWTLAPVLNLDWKLERGNLGLQAGPIWNDRRQNAHFYEVPAAYATANRPAYAARGGYAGWQATTAVSRRIGDWYVAAFARWDSVAGAVFADSPLVGARHNVSYGFVLSRVLASSGTMVKADD